MESPPGSCPGTQGKASPACSEGPQWAPYTPPRPFLLLSQASRPPHTRSGGRAFRDCSTGLGPVDASFRIKPSSVE